MSKVYKKKYILLKILLTILLIPALLSAVSLMISNEVEKALINPSLVSYSGPDDLRVFIDRDPNLVVVKSDADEQERVHEPDSDIVLEVIDERAKVYFSPRELTSMIAYERLSVVLLEYCELSAQGEPVNISYETFVQSRELSGIDEHYTLNSAFKFILASIASFLAFIFFIFGNGKVAYQRFSDYVNGKTTFAAYLASIAVFSFAASSLITVAIYVSFEFIIPWLLPNAPVDSRNLFYANTLLVLFLAGFVLGLTLRTLKSCAKDLFFYPAFLVLCMITVNISEYMLKLPSWQHMVPILNFHGIFVDVIIYGISPGRLLSAIVINLSFGAVCFLLSLSNFKSRRKMIC